MPTLNLGKRSGKSENIHSKRAVKVVLMKKGVWWCAIAYADRLYLDKKEGSIERVEKEKIGLAGEKERVGQKNF